MEEDTRTHAHAAPLAVMEEESSVLIDSAECGMAVLDLVEPVM